MSIVQDPPEMIHVRCLRAALDPDDSMSSRSWKRLFTLHLPRVILHGFEELRADGLVDDDFFSTPLGSSTWERWKHRIDPLLQSELSSRGDPLPSRT